MHCTCLLLTQSGHQPTSCLTPSGVIVCANTMHILNLRGRHETARVHQSNRRFSSGLAARGKCAAVDDAGNRVPGFSFRFRFPGGGTAGGAARPRLVGGGRKSRVFVVWLGGGRERATHCAEL